MSDVAAVMFPQAADAEEALLCAMLLDMPGVFDAHGRRLKDELFHNELHRLMACAMIDLHVTAHPVDMVSVTNWLRRDGQLERVGGPARVADCFSALSTSMGATMAGYYLEILEGMAARRMLLRQADALAAAARDYTQDWKDALLQAEAALFEVHARGSHDGLVHVSKLLPAVVGGIEETVKRKGHVTNGLATGMTSFDRVTMGLKTGVHVLAARPSRGKTTVLLQMALNISLGFGDYPEFDQAAQEVAIFSLETDSEAMVRRGLLNLAAINLHRLRDGQMSYGQQEALTRETKRLMQSKLWIEASYAMSIQDFRSRLRMLVKRHGLKVVFIDYLQLMTSSSKRARDNRQMEIAEISIGLKHTALELGIPIVVLAQLNRDGDVARPKLSHLRECGQIEQDADTVTMICEAPEWAAKNDPEDAPWTYMGLDVVKQKDGPTTSEGDPLVLRFDSEFFRLTSTDQKLFSNDPAQHQGGAGKKFDSERPKRPRGRPRKDGSSETPPYADGDTDETLFEK